MLYVSKHIMEILWARIFVKPQVYWEWGIYICFHLMVDYKAFNTECVWHFLSSTAVTEKLRVTSDFKELARLTGKVQHWEPRLNCVYDNMQYLGVAINNLLDLLWPTYPNIVQILTTPPSATVVGLVSTRWWKPS